MDVIKFVDTTKSSVKHHSIQSLLLLFVGCYNGNENFCSKSAYQPQSLNFQRALFGKKRVLCLGLSGPNALQNGHGFTTYIKAEDSVVTGDTSVSMLVLKTKCQVLMLKVHFSNTSPICYEKSCIMTFSTVLQSL